MERRYIIKHCREVDDGLATMFMTDKQVNVLADEKKAKAFIESLVGCMYDVGGKFEVEVKIF